MATSILILDWDEHYRSYILEAGRRLGLNLYFVLPKPIGALSSYAKDIYILPKLYRNPMQWIDNIVAYVRSHRIDAIVTNEDDLVELAAHACKKIGLPSPSPESVHLSFDKWATRERLSNMGLPGPKYRCVTSLSEAYEAIDEIGLPAVIKPIAAAGGVGAFRLTSRHGLDIAWKNAYEVSLRTPPDYHKIIIEEFMQGPLISVEVAVIEGIPTAVTVTDGLQFEAAYEESCYSFIYKGLLVPSMLDEIATQEVMYLATKAIQSLGIENGIVHAELKYTPQGGKIVEINPRLPGLFLPELVHRALGIDWAEVAMLLALGQKPDLTIQHRKGVCLQLVLPETEGTITNISGFKDMIAAPGVIRAELWKSAGDHVLSLKENVEERIGYVLAENIDSNEALLTAKAAERLLSITLQKDAVIS